MEAFLETVATVTSLSMGIASGTYQQYTISRGLRPSQENYPIHLAPSQQTSPSMELITPQTLGDYPECHWSRPLARPQCSSRFPNFPPMFWRRRYLASPGSQKIRIDSVYFHNMSCNPDFLFTPPLSQGTPTPSFGVSILLSNGRKPLPRCGENYLHQFSRHGRSGQLPCRNGQAERRALFKVDGLCGTFGCKGFETTHSSYYINKKKQ